MGDLDDVLVEESWIVGIDRRQRLRRGDAHAPQRQPFPGAEPADGDRGRGVLGAHLLGAPLLVGAGAALVLANRFDKGGRVVVGTRDATGILGDLQPEPLLVVITLEQRAALLALAAGEGLKQRLVQVVPDEHQPRTVGGRHRDRTGAQHRAP